MAAKPTAPFASERTTTVAWNRRLLPLPTKCTLFNARKPASMARAPSIAVWRRSAATCGMQSGFSICSAKAKLSGLYCKTSAVIKCHASSCICAMTKWCCECLPMNQHSSAHQPLSEGCNQWVVCTQQLAVRWRQCGACVGKGILQVADAR